MRKNLRIVWAGAAALAFLAACPAEADVSVFAVDDAAADMLFSEAMDLEGAVSVGKETFAGSTLGADEEVSLSSSLLAPGVASGPFPNGTTTGLGLYYQTNNLAGNPVTWSPGGSLYATGAGVGGYGFIRVGSENISDSLDLIIDPAAFRGMVRGITFGAAVAGGEILEVRLFDDQHNLLSLESFGTGESGRLTIAVAAAPESTFFRINLWAPDGWTDAGNIEVFAVPEPAASATVAGVLVLLLLWIRRRVSSG